MRTFKSSFSRLLLLSALAGCSDADPKPGPGPNNGVPGSFESDLPASTGGSPGGAKGSDSGAQRAIVEADIVQLAGDRLYALSRVAGLTVIDATDPAHLVILGRFRELNGTPFEMYLRDNVILAMYSGWGQYVKSGDSYSYVQTSKVLALDVADPRAIANIGSFDVAGEVSDSRIVGNVMYVVGHQDGYCWNCDAQKPRTSVTSLNVANPRQVSKVDELFFADAPNGGITRSVTVTDKRMYVAGPEYGSNEPLGSTIQVVDISDPAGDLVEGATVAASGEISSRWQMDEYQGVLRVVSQVPTWSRQSQAMPLVQTFRVDSSQSLTALGSSALQIPANERLNSVRFDGVRGYAITSERKDPLFTIDLSDPANPRQMGELVMPGWVYHMEPRGNRVIGLGYDQNNPMGALTVSVFDVSDLSVPKLLDRVNFGGTWAYLPEDQDRIHKAFRILDDQGLILVPFSGWTDGIRTPKPVCRDNYGDDYDYYSSYQSGVQLVDLNGDDLALRGAAPSHGEARRALVHRQKLLTVSDEAVDSYDLSNRDQPTAIGNLKVARNVSMALPLANGFVARVNQDWYGKQAASLDFVTLADVERPEVNTGEYSLDALLAPAAGGCGRSGYIDNSFVRGNQVNVSYQRYDYDHARFTYSDTLGLATIDASDPAKPVLLSKHEYPATIGIPWSDYYDSYSYGYDPNTKGVLRTDHAVVYLQQRYVVTEQRRAGLETRLNVVDLTDPTKPKQGILALPADTNFSGLVADGNDVMLSHFERGANGKARFYLDRIDLSDLSAPKLASKVNVPGSLLHYDRAHARLLTSELTRVVVENMLYSECVARFAYADFNGPDSICTGYRQTLHLAHLVDGGAVLEGSYPLADKERISSSSLGDGRVAAVISRGHWTRPGGHGCVGACGDAATEPVDLLALGGFDTGTLVSGRLTVASSSDPWWGFWGAPPVYTNGMRALVQSSTDAVVLDLTNVAAPSIVRKVPLYASAQSINTSGNLILMALGTNGVQRVDL